MINQFYLPHMEKMMHTDFKSDEKRVMRYSEFLNEVRDYLADVFSSGMYAKDKNSFFTLDDLFE